MSDVEITKASTRGQIVLPKSIRDEIGIESGDYFALILILLIVLTGDAMRFISHLDLAQTREYFQGLFFFSVSPIPGNPWFLVHYLFAQLLIMYIPFSKILHFGGIFFSEALVHKQ